MKKIVYQSLLLACLLLGPAYAPAQNEITVYVDSVVSDVSNNPLGLNLNWLVDSDIENPDRPRTIESVVEELQLGTLRFPLGGLGENYRWHTPDTDADGQLDYSGAVNGLEPRLWNLSKNPSTNAANPATFKGIWNTQVNPDGTFPRDMDFDEFIQICQATGAEPVVMVGVEAFAIPGGPTYEEQRRSAIEWVRYANVTRNYGVKYWEIGNENDLTKELTAQEYADIVNDFGTAMKQVDPSIKIGANGFAFNTSWYETVLTTASNVIDFIIPHTYLNALKNYEEYRTNDFDYIGLLNPAPGLIEQFAAPEDRDRITIIPTEISSFSPGNVWDDNNANNDLYRSLAFFEQVGNALSLEKLEYLHLWASRNPFGNQSVNDLGNAVGDLTNEILPTGRALQVWSQFLNDKLVQAPRVTGFVRTYASYSEDTQRLTVFLVNKNNVVEPTSVSVPGYTGPSANAKWTYTGQSPQDKNPSWENCGSVALQNNSFNLLLEPFSVTVIAFGETGTTAETLPASPADLTLGQASVDAVELTWTDQADNERRYVIERSINSDDYQIIGTVNANETSFRDLVDTTSAVLTYRVYALNCVGTSDTITATFDYANTIADLNLTSLCSDDPGYERRWRVRNPNNFPINVNWQVYGTSQEGTLEALPGDSFFFTRAMGGPNTTKIRWEDENSMTKQKTKASGGAQCDLAVPADPQNLSATTVQSNLPTEAQVQLSWSDVATNEDVYKIERRQGNEPYTLVAELAANTTSFNDSKLTPGAVYTYRIRAFNNEFGHSQYVTARVATIRAYYRVITNPTERVLEPDNAFANNSEVVTYNWRGGFEKQKWLFESAGDGYFFIKNKPAGKVLTLKNPTTDQNTKDNVVTDAPQGLDRQQWRLVPATGSSFYIVNKASNKYLETDNPFTNNSDVFAGKVTFFNKQRWRFQFIESVASDAPQTLEIAATDDAYVRNGTEFNGTTYFDKNFGSAASLTVRYNPNNLKFWYESFLKFDVSSIDGDIVSVQLKLTPTVVGGSNHTLTEVTDDAWSESDITWNSSRSLAAGSDLATWNAAALTANQSFEVDITDAVVNNQSDGTLSLKLTADANTTPTQYASQENSTVSTHPKLVIEYLPNVSNARTGKTKTKQLTSDGTNYLPYTPTTLYPNPALDRLHVGLTGKQVASVYILDLTGRVVLEEQLKSTGVLDIRSLPDGLYLVKVQQGARIETQKLLIK